MLTENEKKKQLKKIHNNVYIYLSCVPSFIISLKQIKNQCQSLSFVLKATWLIVLSYLWLAEILNENESVKIPRSDK